MTCPYIPSHAILPIKFTKHVLHCHRLHCKEQEKNGKQSLFSICKYDRAHHVRNEDLEEHEANCEARFRPGVGDDWGWDEDLGDGIAAAGYSGGGKSDVGLKMDAEVAPEVTLKEPPPIDENSLKNMQSEDWESEPTYDKRFDAEKRISQLRSSGYSITKYPTPNLTKSEKKEFYACDKEVKKAHKDTYERYEFVKRIQENNAAAVAAKGVWKGPAPTSGVKDPKDDVMLPIRE